MIKRSSRNLALTSDIIVGFPGESEQDFAETMELVRNCEFDGLFIFKYSKRSGTPAANFEDAVSEADKTARFLALEDLQIALQDKIYNRQVGRALSVLVEKQSARSNDDVSGHSTCNKVVNFRGSTTQCGSIIDVLISEAKPNSLYGTAMS
jgi:tRNA-2-methylthio-N6-dimethylallyladenosine synthase